MTPRDELIKAMAAEFVFDEYGWVWSAVSPAFQANVCKQMNVILVAIEAYNGGCIVVPIEPTEEMLIARDEFERTTPTHRNFIEWEAIQASAFYAMSAVSPYAPSCHIAHSRGK